MVRLAAERGHDVTAVVREGTDFVTPAGVRVVRGSVLDRALLAPLIDEHDTVLSGLGLRRASIQPWSRLLSPPDLVEQVHRTLVACPASASLRRIIWISAGGVGESIRQVSAPVRCLIRAGSIGRAYQDLESAEEVLARSELRALAVRPVTLTPGRPTGRAATVDRYGLLSRVRRADVARWMVDVADGTLSHPAATVLLGRR